MSQNFELWEGSHKCYFLGYLMRLGKHHKPVPNISCPCPIDIPNTHLFWEHSQVQFHTMSQTSPKDLLHFPNSSHSMSQKIFLGPIWELFENFHVLLVLISYFQKGKKPDIRYTWEIYPVYIKAYTDSSGQNKLMFLWTVCDAQHSTWCSRMCWAAWRTPALPSTLHSCPTTDRQNRQPLRNRHPAKPHHLSPSGNPISCHRRSTKAIISLPGGSNRTVHGNKANSLAYTSVRPREPMWRTHATAVNQVRAQISPTTLHLINPILLDKVSPSCCSSEPSFTSIVPDRKRVIICIIIIITVVIIIIVMVLPLCA